MKKLFTTGRIKFVVAAFACMQAVSVPAQFAYNYLRAADNYYKKGDYYSAAQYYEKALADKKASRKEKVDPYVVESIQQNKATSGSTKADTRMQIMYKTAESYRLLNNYVKAEPYYKEVVNSSEPFPQARYWYAKSLRFNSKFEEAEKEFTQFLQEQKGDEAIAEDATKEIANLKFIQQELKKDIRLYTVQKLSADGMTHGADYAPSFKAPSSLVFTSTRPDSGATGKKQYINKLYMTAVGGPMATATKMDLPQSKSVHQGVAGFTPDGSTVFVTRWLIQNGKNTAAIYVSKNDGSKWSEPVMLDSNINASGYSSQQPYVAKDGNLYFSSEKPGGQGKFDLYAASLSADGTPGSPVNLGPVINTKEDEQAPYIFEPTGGLIFSSNGRVGMGGFDFYETKKASGGWQQPVNLGYPVNSVKDDIYLVSTGTKQPLETVYMSSDRSSECCLEMYVLNKRIVKKLVAGIVVDCKTGSPISGATVTVTGQASGQPVASRTTNNRGRYELLLDEYQPLKVTAQAEGYPSKTLQVVTPENAERDSSLNPDLCLTRPDVPKPYEVDKAVVLNNIYYDFGKAAIRIESHAMLDSLAADMKRAPGMVIELSAHTDNLGSDEFNQRLSEQRAQSCVDYLISQGIDSSRMVVKGYGETVPIAPNQKENGRDNPAGRKQNRRTEFKVLHY